MLISSLEGRKVYSHIGWGAWSDFSLDQGNAYIPLYFPCRTFPIVNLQQLNRTELNTVACRGGCGRCDGPRHPPWGASNS